MTYLRKCDCLFKVTVCGKVSFLTAYNDFIANENSLFILEGKKCLKDSETE